MGTSMKLYGYYRSSASYRIRIALNAKHIDYDNAAVLLNKGAQHTAQFKAINPMGLVPVLETNDGVFAQSPAIIEYLEEIVPKPTLLPGGPANRARIREMMNLIGCDIHPIQNLRILKHLRGEFGQDDEGVANWCRKWIAAGFDAYEILAQQRSSSGRFSMGDELTLADIWLVPQLYNARRFKLDLTPYPRIVSIDAHCATLDCFAGAHPSRQADAPDKQPTEPSQ